LNEQQKVLTTKKYLLQKIAKILSIICIIVAVCTGIYLFTLPNEGVLKSTLGVVAFFFSTMGAVFYAIASANLPDLSIKSDEK
jgi:DMSO/TMAO reductase YedYZ heme-binding membrane subunit